MKSTFFIASGLTCALIAGSALASPCGDQINALEARLNAVAESAGAASSGGQAVAAAREGQAVQAQEQGKPVEAPAVPFQKDAQEAQAGQKAAQAGGDKVIQAKATLNRARTLDQQGNGAACSEAVAEAGRQLGPSQ